MKKIKTNHHKKIENLEAENQALKDLLEMNRVFLNHSTRKKISQSFEIIDLKEKISDLRMNIGFLVFAVIFISIICIIK